MGTIDAIRQAIEAHIDGARAEVRGDGRHFEISVTSKAFEGLGTLERHRLVLAAIKDLMGSDDAPVHAIDRIETKTG